MALKHTVTTSNITSGALTDCYIKITEIRLVRIVDDVNITICLDYWLTQQDRDDGKAPFQNDVVQTTMTITQLDNINIYTKAYDYVKSLTDFSGASDV